MKRARHQLSPLMPFEKSIDRCLIYFMPYSLLKFLLDLCNSSKFSFFCTLEEWRQQFLFFLQCQIFISSSDKCGAALVILAIALSFRSWFPLFRILPQTASWYQVRDGSYRIVFHQPGIAPFSPFHLLQRA